MEYIINEIKTNLKKTNKLIVFNSACPWKRLEIQQTLDNWYLLESIAQNIDGIEEHVISRRKIDCHSIDLFNTYLNKELDWVKGDTLVNKLIVQKLF